MLIISSDKQLADAYLKSAELPTLSAGKRKGEVRRFKKSRIQSERCSDGSKEGQEEE